MTPDTTERDAAPCFSVITPAYNAADSVAATIASVRAQDLGDWEMVVVDDGSSDITADVAREAAAGDPRIRVVSQPNAEVSAARNAAIGLSHGEFICTLDADDRYKPDYLSSMSRFIAEYPGCDLYSCNGEFVFPSGMLVPVRKGRRFKRAQSFSVEEMFERNLVFIMATIRRTALERIGGFREDLTVAEDYDVWMRILMTGGAHMYNPERLGLYGLTEGSASTDFDRLERAPRGDAVPGRALPRSGVARRVRALHGASAHAGPPGRGGAALERRRVAWHAGGVLLGVGGLAHTCSPLRGRAVGAVEPAAVPPDLSRAAVPSPGRGFRLMTTLTMIALVAGFMVLPALPAGWVIARKIGGGPSAAVALAFTFSVASAGAVSMVSWFAGVGLSVSLGLHLALLVAVDLAAVIKAGGLRRLSLRQDAPVAAISALVALVAWWERAWMAPNMDVFYHMAAARSLQFFDRAVITDPFYGVGGPGPDPTAGALNVLLGLASHAWHVDPAALWTGLNVFAAMLSPIVFWTLFRQLRVSRRGALVATLALVFIQTSADFRMAAYPNRVGMLVMVVALAGVAAALRGRKTGLAIAAVGGFAASATHTGVAFGVLIAGAVIAVGMGIYARRAEKPSARRARLLRRSWIAVAAMAGMALLAVAPRLWFVVSSEGVGGVDLPSSSTGLAEHGVYRLFGVGVMFDPEAAYSGGALLVVLGTAMAVLCLVSAVRGRKPLMALAAAISLIPVAMGFNPVVTPALLALSPYVAWRALNLFGFAPYVVLAHAWRDRPTIARIALAGALVGALPAYHMQFSGEPPVALRGGMMNVAIWQGWERDARFAGNSTAIGGIANVIGETWPVIATDELTGYDMCGFMPCRVVAVPAGHAPAFMEADGEGDQRRRDMIALFDPMSSPARREHIVRTWDAEYVLLWSGRVQEDVRHEMMAQDDVFEVVYEFRDITLLEVVSE